jgi:hypothetical protein
MNPILPLLYFTFFAVIAGGAFAMMQYWIGRVKDNTQILQSMIEYLQVSTELC